MNKSALNLYSTVRDGAVCVGDERSFSDSKAVQSKFISEMCYNCPVMEQCLQLRFTLNPRPRDGVWGGTTRGRKWKVKR